jgi:hypothetical protein
MHVRTSSFTVFFSRVLEGSAAFQCISISVLRECVGFCGLLTSFSEAMSACLLNLVAVAVCLQSFCRPEREDCVNHSIYSHFLVEGFARLSVHEP